MSKIYKPALLVDIIINAVLGALLLALPGRVLTLLGWQPIDPIISRILGAALMAFAWGGVRVWRGASEPEAKLLLQMELVFDGLGAIGILRHLVVASWPWYIWLLFIVMAAYALLRAGVLMEKRKA